MTTMISEVYDAFRAAGVPEDKARKAAEAMSSEATATKGDVSRLETRSDASLATIRTDIAVLKWIAGFNLAFTMAVLWKVLS